MIKKILDIVGWLGTALVVAAVFVRGGIWLGRFAERWDPYAKYAAVTGLACVVLFTLGQWREIVDYFRQRNARYGAIAGASVLVFVGILVAVNYLSFRQNKRWDLTKNQQYSLSDQTVKLLQNLKDPVTFEVFYKSDDLDRFRTVLDQYKYVSPSKVNVAYFDIDKKPVEAKQRQIEVYGTVVVNYEGRTQKLTAADEQSLTNGLIKVLTPEKKKVYFVQGHRERDPDSSERIGYSSVKDALTRENYDVAKIVLAQEKDVPADASVIIIAGPHTDLLQGEADMLERYLKKGGHVMVLVDPTEDTDPPTPVLDALLKNWDFQLDKDVVVDAQAANGDPSIPVAAQYPQHPITERMGGLLTAFPLSRSITPILPASNGRAAVPIIQSSPRSWGETDMKQFKAGQLEPNPDKGDKPGPVTIGAVTATIATDIPKPDPAKTASGDEARTPESRFLTMGDSDFAANYIVNFQGNRDFFVNSVDWLAEQENLISIKPKAPSDSRLTITPRQAIAVLVMSLLIIPALVFGTGFYTYWRKR